MTTKFQRILIILCSIPVLILGACPLHGAMAEDSQRRFSKTELGDDQFCYQYRLSSIYGKEKGFVIAAMSWPVDEIDSMQICLWKVNTAGEKVAETTLTDIDSSSVPARGIQALQTLDNGDVMAVIKSQGDVSLMRLDANLKTVFVKKIVEKGWTSEINKILISSEDKLLLIGSQGAVESIEALAISASVDGEIFWKKTFSRGKPQQSFLDGVAALDDGFLLVGNLLTADDDENANLQKSEVWVVRLDAEGNLKEEKFFPGHYGSVCRDSRGNYTILYGGTAYNYDSGYPVWAQALGPDMTELWRRKVLDAPLDVLLLVTTAPPFIQIASTGEGLIAAVMEKERLTVLGLDGVGVEKWRASSDPDPKQLRTSDYGIHLSGNDLFILGDVYHENEKRQFNFRIGILKLVPDEST